MKTFQCWKISSNHHVFTGQQVLPTYLKWKCIQSRSWPVTNVIFKCLKVSEIICCPYCSCMYFVTLLLRADSNPLATQSTQVLKMFVFIKILKMNPKAFPIEWKHCETCFQSTLNAFLWTSSSSKEKIPCKLYKSLECLKGHERLKKILIKEEQSLWKQSPVF